jgi:hypothetical protein
VSVRARHLVLLSVVLAGVAFAQGVTKSRVSYPAPTTDLTIPATLLMPAAAAPVLAERSRRETVEFFSQAFGVTPKP